MCPATFLLASRALAYAPVLFWNPENKTIVLTSGQILTLNNPERYNGSSYVPFPAGITSFSAANPIRVSWSPAVTTSDGGFFAAEGYRASDNTYTYLELVTGNVFDAGSTSFIIDNVRSFPSGYVSTGGIKYVSNSGSTTYYTANPALSAPLTFTDDFNRTDRELNGDNGWTTSAAQTGLFVITAGILATPVVKRTTTALTSDGINGYASATRAAISQTRQIVEAYLGNGAASGLCWAWLSDGNSYYARLSGGTIDIRRFTTAGGNEQIASYAAANGSTVRIDHNFDTGVIRTYVGGVLAGTITGRTASLSGSKVGIIGLSGNEIIDNFVTAG